MKRIEELKDIIKGKKNEENPKAPERELPAPSKMSMPLSDVFAFLTAVGMLLHYQKKGRKRQPGVMAE